MAKKIFVCCPGDAVTGGPELLHQLVDALRKLGKEAYISYYPFDRQFNCPEPYCHYQAPQQKIEDTAGCLIVLPEVATRFAKNFSKAEISIWWLSVDNYLDMTRENFARDYYRHIKNLLLGHKLPIFKMRGYRHFVQSEYARQYLEHHGLTGHFLTDYLGEHHMQGSPQSITRENIIAFNPKKGKRITEQIIKDNPGMHFTPIQNMTPRQVRELLEKAKLYIDFGQHPGKDRFPREAAIAGCCVITGRRGSASNGVDVMIPEKYKLDEQSSDLSILARKIISDILNSFDKHTKDFDDYRQKIIEEPLLFRQQVAQIFAEF